MPRANFGSKSIILVMNIITWNCIGTSNRGFASHIKDLMREYDASMLFLWQTHSSGQMLLGLLKVLV